MVQKILNLLKTHKQKIFLFACRAEYRNAQYELKNSHSSEESPLCLLTEYSLKIVVTEGFVDNQIFLQEYPFQR